MSFLRILILIIAILILALAYFCLVGKAKQADDITWAVAFSSKHSYLLGLDWKENYLALLDDLKVRDLKIIAYWDFIEREKDNYDFSEIDWQVKEAEKRGAKILLTIGRKVPRWPECHEPEWLKEREMEERNEELFEYLELIVNRYKDKDSIWAWQIENEPFLPFGECPEFDENVLKKEVELVKRLDESRPVVLTESGEFHLWFKPARISDIVGHTLYRKVWFKEFNTYITYPFAPAFYARKVWLIEKLFQKKVLCSELQAEPWGRVLLYDLPFEEQEKTMNIECFKEVIEYAKGTGEDTFYLWGAEWWYWMKQHGQTDIWEEARQLFLFE